MVDYITAYEVLKGGGNKAGLGDMAQMEQSGIVVHCPKNCLYDTYDEYLYYRTPEASHGDGFCLLQDKVM